LFFWYSGIGEITEDLSSGATIVNQLVNPNTISTSVWSEDEALEVVKLLGNKVTKSGDIITIYEDDGTTIWKQFDLSGGGRVEV